MESIQGAIDGIKSATYEVSAIILPGIVLLGVAHALVATPIPNLTLAWVVAGYAVGLALQGLASAAVQVRCARWLIGGISLHAESPTPAETRARAIVQETLGSGMAEKHLLDVALTRVHPNRHVYDKFLALADTARALALVALITVGLVFYGMREALDTRTPWFVVAGVLLAWFGFRERHGKFAPLAYKALYGKFVAMHVQGAATAPGATAPNPHPTRIDP